MCFLKLNLQYWLVNNFPLFLVNEHQSVCETSQKLSTFTFSKWLRNSPENTIFTHVYKLWCWNIPLQGSAQHTWSNLCIHIHKIWEQQRQELTFTSRIFSKSNPSLHPLTIAFRLLDQPCSNLAQIIHHFIW